MATVEPLPLVPATWTTGNRVCGSPTAANSRRTRVRPKVPGNTVVGTARSKLSRRSSQASAVARVRQPLREPGIFRRLPRRWSSARSAGAELNGPNPGRSVPSGQRPGAEAKAALTPGPCSQTLPRPSFPLFFQAQCSAPHGDITHIPEPVVCEPALRLARRCHRVSRLREWIGAGAVADST